MEPLVGAMGGICRFEQRYSGAKFQESRHRSHPVYLGTPATDPELNHVQSGPVLATADSRHRRERPEIVLHSAGAGFSAEGVRVAGHPMVRELNGQFTGISGSSCMSSGAAAQARATSTGHVWPIKPAATRDGRSFTASPRKVSGTKMLRKSSEFGGQSK